MKRIKSWRKVRVGDLIFTDHGGDIAMVSECVYKDSVSLCAEYIVDNFKVESKPLF
jgi:hypothetical protein